MYELLCSDTSVPCGMRAHELVVKRAMLLCLTV